MEVDARSDFSFYRTFSEIRELHVAEMLVKRGLLDKTLVFLQLALKNAGSDLERFRLHWKCFYFHIEMRQFDDAYLSLMQLPSDYFDTSFSTALTNSSSLSTPTQKDPQPLRLISVRQFAMRSLVYSMCEQVDDGSVARLLDYPAAATLDDDMVKCLESCARGGVCFLQDFSGKMAGIAAAPSKPAQAKVAASTNFHLILFNLYFRFGDFAMAAKWMVLYADRILSICSFNIDALVTASRCLLMAKNALMLLEKESAWFLVGEDVATSVTKNSSKTGGATASRSYLAPHSSSTTATDTAAPPHQPKFSLIEMALARGIVSLEDVGQLYLVYLVTLKLCRHFSADGEMLGMTRVWRVTFRFSCSPCAL